MPPTYTLGLIFTVPDTDASDSFMSAIQDLIDNADDSTNVEAATVTGPDGSVIDMLVETDVEEEREHKASAYDDPAAPSVPKEGDPQTQAQPSEPNEESAQNAIPTDKEL